MNDADTVLAEYADQLTALLEQATRLKTPATGDSIKVGRIGSRQQNAIAKLTDGCRQAAAPWARIVAATVEITVDAPARRQATTHNSPWSPGRLLSYAMLAAAMYVVS